MSLAVEKALPLLPHIVERKGQMESALSDIMQVEVLV